MTQKKIILIEKADVAVFKLVIAQILNIARMRQDSFDTTRNDNFHSGHLSKEEWSKVAAAFLCRSVVRLLVSLVLFV